MSPRAVTAALVVLLIVATAVLGYTIGAGGYGGASNGSLGASSSETTAPNPGPKLVINATTVAEGYLYASTSYKQVPAYMLAPLAGLKLVIIGEQLAVITRPGRPPTYQVLTNSTGIGEAYLPRGNYSVQTEGGGFNFTGQLRLLSNTTTYLSVLEYPVMRNVSHIQAVNQAPTVEVGTSSVLYVEIQGGFQYSPYGTYQLIGPVSGSNASAAVPGAIEGAYSAPGGTVVVMQLYAPFEGSFTQGARLMYFQAASDVTYGSSTAGVVGNGAP